MTQHIRAAVIGGSQSGKTFRTAGYSVGLWKTKRLRSLVFDPWKGETDWGAGAWVSSDFDQWKKVVTNTRGCVAIWDEATAYGGRERENVPLFSQIRHLHPVLFCIGHAYSSILPIMRVNLTDLYISLADPDDAAEWAKVMKDPKIDLSTRLLQYQFLHKRSFHPVRILSETASQIRAGILP